MKNRNGGIWRAVLAALCGLAIGHSNYGERVRAPLAGEPTGEIVVRLEPEASPAAVAQSLGAEWRGAVRGVSGFHRFVFPDLKAALTHPAVSPAESRRRSLEGARHHPQVQWAEAQERRWHMKHAALPFDPYYTDQWHLHNTGQTLGSPGEDLNVEAAWAQGITGQGVVVAVVDDGVEGTHADLTDGYRAELGLDVNDNDNTPFPRLSTDTHGTAVAGVALSRANNICGVGPAFGAMLAGVRLISGPTTDAEEAEGLSHRRDVIAIYNNSWGPDTSYGSYLAGPGLITEQAMEESVQSGRGGLGSIYVWAAGNSGEYGDNANYDGYANARTAICVGAVDENGQRIPYSEPGACLFVVAPSQSENSSILTTDRMGGTGESKGDCTDTFGGTSAAAPQVAGVAALLLQANPQLGWRDIKHILARTAVKNDRLDPGWSTNGAGFHVHDRYGFGRVDAGGAVALAGEWTPVATEKRVSSGQLPINRLMTSSGLAVQTQIFPAMTVEHVEVVVRWDHPNFGELKFVLQSPSGSISTLAEAHEDAVEDYTDGGREIPEWKFMTVRHWGEPAEGVWTLTAIDTVNARTTGDLVSWELTIHGVDRPPNANRRPLAVDDTLALTALPTARAVLANDFDPDGDPLRLIAIYRPQHGEVAVLADHSVSYMPNASFKGQDRFGYTISDGRGETSQAWVVVNAAMPVALPDIVVGRVGQPVTVSPLGNDANISPYTVVESFAQPAYGRAEAEGATQIRYVPDSLEGGQDAFSYTLSGSSGASTANVTVTLVEESDLAVRFMGQERIDAGNFANLNLTGPLTIEAWIKPSGWGANALSGYGRIFDKGKFAFFLTDKDNPFGFYNNYSLVFYASMANGGEGAAQAPANTVKLGVWQHVAVSYDGGGVIRMYLNGQQLNVGKPSNIDLPGGKIAANAGDGMYIGDSDRSFGPRGFEGDIAEVRLWNLERTAVQIQSFYDKTLTGQETGLVSWWPLDEGRGSQTAERVQGSNGALEGARWVPRNGVPPPVKRFFPSALADVNGWYQSPWFGWFRDDYFPFLWHLQHGWLYVAARVGSGDQLWMWPAQPGDDWWFTGNGYYPYIYSFKEGDWIVYVVDSADPRQFWKTDGSTFTLP